MPRLTLTDIWVLKALTKLQEITYRLYILSDGKLQDFFGRAFDKVSAMHFERWFGQDLEQLLGKMKSGVLDEKTQENLALKVIKPFALRQVKIQSKTWRIYKNEKSSKKDIEFMTVILSVKMITGKSHEECVQGLIDYAARKAS